jgi:hypothetical protein
MLDIRRDDLVLRAEAQAGDRDVAPVARRAGQGDCRGGRADGIADGVPRSAAQVADVVEVRLAEPSLLELLPLALDERLDGIPRQRPERAGVQVGDAGQHGELGSDRGEVHGHIIAASTGHGRRAETYAAARVWPGRGD